MNRRLKHCTALLLTACIAGLATPALAQEAGAAANGAQRDRLQLDTTSITGNQELPRVMAIVPWKDSGIGELAGRPVNSLLDEVLAPIDREVFGRQVSYYEQLYTGQAPATAGE